MPVVELERVGLQYDSQAGYANPEARQVKGDAWRQLEAAVQPAAEGGPVTWLDGAWTLVGGWVNGVFLQCCHALWQLCGQLEYCGAELRWEPAAVRVPLFSYAAGRARVRMLQACHAMNGPAPALRQVPLPMPCTTPHHAGGSRASMAGQQAEHTCVVGEAVGVEVELSNPLQVELAVTRLRLGCSFEPAGGAGAQPAGSSAAAPAAAVASSGPSIGEKPRPAGLQVGGLSKTHYWACWVAGTRCRGG